MTKENGMELRVTAFEFGSLELVVVSAPLVADNVQVDLTRLTRAERDVARCISLGMTNHEIAMARRVAPSTVANQVASVLRKLKVACRSEVAALVASHDFHVADVR